jgi:predicted nucleic acid-binding protein
MSTGTDANGQQVVLLDTSTAVALILEDHEVHDSTLDAVRGRRLGLAGHAWVETYSVLTRLPAGLRRSPADAFFILNRNFPASEFLGEAEAAELVRELARLGISGGAVYDALVGAAARQHQRSLTSRDARARPVYEALGVEVEVIA